MGRPRKLPYSSVDGSRMIYSSKPDSFEQWIKKDLCPKVTGIWVKRCDNEDCIAGPDGKVWMFTPDTCGRRACLICSRAGDRKRGKSLTQRIGGKGFGILVLTLPRPFDESIPGPALRELEKRFRLALEATYETHEKVRIGYRIAWHPTGDTCDECGHQEKSRHAPHISALRTCTQCGADTKPHPHLNIIIPLWGWDLDRPDHLTNPVMRQLSAKLKPAHLLSLIHI